jgi:hypothetical protein
VNNNWQYSNSKRVFTWFFSLQRNVWSVEFTERMHTMVTQRTEWQAQWSKWACPCSISCRCKELGKNMLNWIIFYWELIISASIPTWTKNRLNGLHSFSSCAKIKKNSRLSHSMEGYADSFINLEWEFVKLPSFIPDWFDMISNWFPPVWSTEIPPWRKMFHKWWRGWNVKRSSGYESRPKTLFLSYWIIDKIMG